ncbi:MAG TPA: fasciclin domain-containing protein [Stellaceae bacterium]|nr:fasciclin domain-containing protein [Stellaceae bacterium]
MKLKLLMTSAALALTMNAGAMAQTGGAMSGGAQTAPMVGGAPMYPTKNIIENAVNSKDHTTLVAAVKAAGLVQTLEGPGPFTVFAPTNEAFAALPAGTVDTLLKPENKAKLTQVLTYHVVPGRYDAATLAKDAKAAGGRVSLKTVEGEPLIVSQNGAMLMVTDTKGGSAQVTIPDVFQSNGVIMVVNKVLMP